MLMQIDTIHRPSLGGDYEAARVHYLDGGRSDVVIHGARSAKCNSDDRDVVARC